MPPKEEPKKDEPKKDVEGATTEETSTDPDKKKDVEGATTGESSTDTIPGQNPETKKCEGEDTCAGQGAADELHNIGGVTDNMKAKLDDTVKNGVKNIMVTLKNPAKCATMMVSSMPILIDNIGNAVSGSIDKIANSINNTATAVTDKGLLTPFKVAHALFMLKLHSIFDKIALGPDAEKILSDPNLTPQMLFDKLKFRTNIYKLALKDAEFRGELEKWIKSYMASLRDALKIAQPEIDRINAEVKAIIEGMGDNVGESLGHAITNVIASAVSALPGVGAVVSSIKSIDQLSQEIINACKPPIAKGAGIIMPMVNEFNKQQSKLNCEITKFERKVDPVFKRLEAKLTPQIGGARSTKRPNIHKITKRVNYMLKRFTSRRKKINYTRKLNMVRH